MIRKSLSSLFTLPLLLTACVTINIYFPAAAAEKAADRIIEDVWGKEQPAEQQPQPKPQDDKGARLDQRPPAVVMALLDLLVPAAEAAEADISISTPAIDRLRGSMRNRHEALRNHYDSGAIGLTRDALITLRDPGVVALKERNQVKRLVADENGDRNALYRAIAQANGHPEWENDIRMTFAKRWVGNARAGWWYQDGSGNWRRK